MDTYEAEVFAVQWGQCPACGQSVHTQYVGMQVSLLHHDVSNDADAWCLCGKDIDLTRSMHTQGNHPMVGCDALEAVERDQRRNWEHQKACHLVRRFLGADEVEVVAFHLATLTLRWRYGDPPRARRNRRPRRTLQELLLESLETPGA